MSRYVLDYDPDDSRPYVLEHHGIPVKRRIGFTVTDLQSDPQGKQPEISQDAPRVRGKPPEAGDPRKPHA